MHISLYLIIFIFGLVFGSFFNVVIYRWPIMLAKQWRNECLTYLKQTVTPDNTHFNLFLPRSQCPHCKSMVAWWCNIPLLSYILLRGRCQHCQHPISWRYPFVELLTAVAACVVFWCFGWHYLTLVAMLFSSLLIIAIFIDLDHLIIPDQISLGLLWLGLLVNSQHYFTSLNSAVLGAIAGYGILWLVMHVYKLFTGKYGMGHGDFKLLAALGAWLGWQLLPIVLFLAALAGSLIGIGLILLAKHQRDQPLPFGPFLAIAGWIGLLWGKQLSFWYMSFLGWH